MPEHTPPTTFPRRAAMLVSLVPRVTAGLLGVLAVAGVLWTSSPSLREFTRGPREYLDRYFFAAPADNPAWIALLIVAGVAAFGRKRLVWWALTLYLLSWVPRDLADLTRSTTAAALIALGTHLILLAVLGAARRQFPARLRPGGQVKALGVFAGSITIGWGLGGFLVELFPGTLPSGIDRPLWALNQLTGTVLLPQQAFAGAPATPVNLILGLAGALAILSAIGVLLRAQRTTNALTEAEEAALKQLADQSEPEDSLSYFATRRDKSVIFAPGGRAAIAYQVAWGVCLAHGDPLGPRTAWPQAITAWLNLARRFGWTPAVVGASTLGANAYRQAGLLTRRCGDEAVLDTREFSLAGADMAPIRQAANHLRKRGATVRIRRHHDIPVHEFGAIFTRAQSWQDTVGERGFADSLGRFHDPLDGDCLLVEALDANERVLAMLSLVPWGPHGVTVELVRQPPYAAAGVRELMLTQLGLTGEQLGIQTISLNYTVDRSTIHTGERLGINPTQRFWDALLLRLPRWWRMDKLYRSQVRYHPQWVPRYLAVAAEDQWAQAAVAAARTEGFAPRLGRHVDLRAHTGRHPAPESLPDPAAHQSSTPTETSGAAETSDPRGCAPGQGRRRALKRREALGLTNYPPAYPPTHTVAAARHCPTGTTVRVCGRLSRIRDHGGVLFAVVQDGSAVSDPPAPGNTRGTVALPAPTDPHRADIQLIFDANRLGYRRCAEFGAFFDLGDVIEVSGRVGHSRRGELSLLVADWRLLSKCLHPLPDKWRGLTNPRSRVRQRPVDLLVNPAARRTVEIRSAVLRSLRETLSESGFLETETPILQQRPGGTPSAGFHTHSQAYDMALTLRTSPELYLKRLCVSGMERLFELGRGFHNGGLDPQRSPEFTELTVYAAHQDYHGMLALGQQLIQQAAHTAHGAVVARRPRSDNALAQVDISGDWPVHTVYGAVSAVLGTEITPATPRTQLWELCGTAGVPRQVDADAGALVHNLYRQLVVRKTTDPTWYIDFPASVCPLARAHRHTSGLAERGELVAWGVVVGAASSELTDPVEQRRRLTAQAERATQGDPRALRVDEDFLYALEHGLPPTGGLRLGVDRIVMLLTGGSIRETIPFPLVKPV